MATSLNNTLPLKMDLPLPVSANTKTKLFKISCNSSRNSFPTQCVSSSPRARDHNHNHLKLHSDVRNAGGRRAKTAVRASQNESETEQPSFKNKIIPLSPRGERFKEEFLSMIVPWEKIPVSFDTFPCHIDDHTKTLLMECVASHLKHSKLKKYHGILKYSSEKILLQSIPGTELCRERVVSELARELQVPLLKLDSRVLPPPSDEDGCKHNGPFSRAFEENFESDDETPFYDESDDDDDNDEEEELEVKYEVTSYGMIKKIDTGVYQFKKGDRVKYLGNTISFDEVNNRILSTGQRGEVYEVNGEKVAVVFNICGLKRKKAVEDEKNTDIHQQALVTWVDVKYVNQDLDARTHDCLIALEALYVVLQSQQSVIVYFPDSFVWPSNIRLGNMVFLKQLEEVFKQLSGAVMICAENKRDFKSELMNNFPTSLKKCIKRLKGPRFRVFYDMHKLFPNVVCIKPPKDQDFLYKLSKQIEEIRLSEISEGNLKLMQKVLKRHNLSCMTLEHSNISDMKLTWGKAKKIVGWATNHYLSSCLLPRVDNEKLDIPLESIKLAILRLKEEKQQSKKKRIKLFSMNTYEDSIVSAVVRPEDIGVKFDDVGALEHVKKVLHETVILPMRRPELFSHGNLLKPCKGILLFGPPGTGKTLIAKALATESGANFINVTAATITRKYVGESEHLTRALFSYASKLAPTIIFVDEVDNLLGARGHNRHDTSRLNEFMAAWDGLISKDSQRILVIGATNRPFDLDDAVLRRMPRRIYVGLPDVENRSKILKVLLKKENLDSGFSFDRLAMATEGYSGSDLKNLCAAAAYRPVQEFLEQESNGEASDGVPPLRPLKLHDFIISKAKVRPSVASNASTIMKLKEWQEQFGEEECQSHQNKEIKLFVDN